MDQNAADKKIRDVSVGDVLSLRMSFYTLEDKKLHLLDFVSKKPLILFYFLDIHNEKCQRLLQAYEKNYEKIKQCGFEVIAICPHPLTFNKEDFKHTFPFQIFLDKECVIARNIGNAHWQNMGGVDELEIKRICYVIDAYARIHWSDEPSDANAHIESLVTVLPALFSPVPTQDIQNQAPVLIIPKLFEMPLCDNLSQLYHATQSNRATNLPENYELTLYEAVKRKIVQRVPPMLYKNFGTKGELGMERARLISKMHWPVADKVHFERIDSKSERDFVMLCHLSREHLEGGQVVFPQFNNAAYQVRSGDALIFSASLFYRFNPIIKGNPLLYVTFFSIKAAEEKADENSDPKASEPPSSVFISDVRL